MTSFAESLRVARLPRLESRHWPGTLVLSTAALLYMFAGLSLASDRVSDGRAEARGLRPIHAAALSRLAKAPPPVPEPLAFRDMTPEEAAAYNAAIPISGEDNPAARAFAFAPATDGDRLRAIDCLTAAVYYEAATEPTEGQQAVAQVVLNRVRHPAFPKTVCGVVFEGSERATGCQFTFTCDGSLARIPSAAGWARARSVAEKALAGTVYKPAGYATHYHTYWVVPYWSASLTKLANVGDHIFYRWEGGWGRPPAFRHAAIGVEPQIASLRHLSSAPAEPGDDAGRAGATLADATVPASAGGELADRAVVRRYQPLREASAANTRAELAKAGVPLSLRWALTGETSPVEGPLSGVRRKDAAPADRDGAATSAAPTEAARTVRN